MFCPPVHLQIIQITTTTVIFTVIQCPSSYTLTYAVIFQCSWFLFTLFTASLQQFLLFQTQCLRSLKTLTARENQQSNTDGRELHVHVQCTYYTISSTISSAECEYIYSGTSLIQTLLRQMRASVLERC